MLAQFEEKGLRKKKMEDGVQIDYAVTKYWVKYDGEDAAEETTRLNITRMFAKLLKSKKCPDEIKLELAKELNNTAAIRGNQRQSEAIRGHQRQSEAIRGNQRQSEAIRGNQRPSEAIIGNQGQSEAIRGNQGGNQKQSGRQSGRQSEAIRGNQGGNQRQSEAKVARVRGCEWTCERTNGQTDEQVLKFQGEMKFHEIS